MSHNKYFASITYEDPCKSARGPPHLAARPPAAVWIFIFNISLPFSLKFARKLHSHHSSNRPLYRNFASFPKFEQNPNITENYRL